MTVLGYTGEGEVANPSNRQVKDTIRISVDFSREPATILIRSRLNIRRQLLGIKMVLSIHFTKIQVITIMIPETSGRSNKRKLMNSKSRPSKEIEENSKEEETPDA